MKFKKMKKNSKKNKEIIIEEITEKENVENIIGDESLLKNDKKRKRNAGNEKSKRQKRNEEDILRGFLFNLWLIKVSKYNK